MAEDSVVLKTSELRNVNTVHSLRMEARQNDRRKDLHSLLPTLGQGQTLVIDHRSLSGQGRVASDFARFFRESLVAGRRILITSAPVQSIDRSEWDLADLRIVAPSH